MYIIIHYERNDYRIKNLRILYNYTDVYILLRKAYYYNGLLQEHRANSTKMYMEVQPTTTNPLK